MAAWDSHPDVDATENYWGTGDPVKIEGRFALGLLEAVQIFEDS